jgi:hypothetical protein
MASSSSSTTMPSSQLICLRGVVGRVLSVCDNWSTIRVFEDTTATSGAETSGVEETPKKRRKSKTKKGGGDDDQPAAATEPTPTPTPPVVQPAIRAAVGNVNVVELVLKNFEQMFETKKAEKNSDKNNNDADGDEPGDEDPTVECARRLSHEHTESNGNGGQKRSGQPKTLDSNIFAQTRYRCVFEVFVRDDAANDTLAKPVQTTDGDDTTTPPTGRVTLHGRERVERVLAYVDRLPRFGDSVVTWCERPLLQKMPSDRNSAALRQWIERSPTVAHKSRSLTFDTDGGSGGGGVLQLTRWSFGMALAEVFSNTTNEKETSSARDALVTLQTFIANVLDERRRLTNDTSDVFNLLDFSVDFLDHTASAFQRLFESSHYLQKHFVEECRPFFSESFIDTLQNHGRPRDLFVMYVRVRRDPVSLCFSRNVPVAFRHTTNTLESVEMHPRACLELARHVTGQRSPWPMSVVAMLAAYEKTLQTSRARRGDSFVPEEDFVAALDGSQHTTLDELIRLGYVCRVVGDFDAVQKTALGKKIELVCVKSNTNQSGGGVVYARADFDTYKKMIQRFSAFASTTDSVRLGNVYVVDLHVRSNAKTYTTDDPTSLTSSTSSMVSAMHPASSSFWTNLRTLEKATAIEIVGDDDETDDILYVVDDVSGVSFATSTYTGNNNFSVRKWHVLPTLLQRLITGCSVVIERLRDVHRRLAQSDDVTVVMGDGTTDVISPVLVKMVRTLLQKSGCDDASAKATIRAAQLTIDELRELWFYSHVYAVRAVAIVTQSSVPCSTLLSLLEYLPRFAHLTVLDRRPSYLHATPRQDDFVSILRRVFTDTDNDDDDDDDSEDIENAEMCPLDALHAIAKDDGEGGKKGEMVEFVPFESTHVALRDQSRVDAVIRDALGGDLSSFWSAATTSAEKTRIIVRTGLDRWALDRACAERAAKCDAADADENAGGGMDRRKLLVNGRAVKSLRILASDPGAAWLCVGDRVFFQRSYAPTRPYKARMHRTDGVDRGTCDEISAIVTCADGRDDFSYVASLPKPSSGGVGGQKSTSSTTTYAMLKHSKKLVVLDQRARSSIRRTFVTTFADAQHFLCNTLVVVVRPLLSGKKPTVSVAAKDDWDALSVPWNELSSTAMLATKRIVVVGCTREEFVEVYRAQAQGSTSRFVRCRLHDELRTRVRK